MIGKIIIQEKSCQMIEGPKIFSGMLSFKARWLVAMMFWIFCPKSWGFNNYDSQFDVLRLICFNWVVIKPTKGCLIFKHAVGLKEFTPQLSFDAVKNGALVRVTFDIPIDNE